MVANRFEVIRNPPFNKRCGKPRWTGDEAKRVRRWQVQNPVSVQEKSVQEKVTAIHGLAAPSAKPTG